MHNYLEGTLLLNASFEPIKVISWQKAITLLFLGKVQIVEEYDREIRSVSLVLKMPSIVRLTRYVRLQRRRPPLSRANLLARDMCQCQYCGVDLNAQQATIDHVLPRSRGGAATWLNLVIACGSCNRKKGDRTPEEANMTLISKPLAPEWLPVLRLNPSLPKAWLEFLRL